MGCEEGRSGKPSLQNNLVQKYPLTHTHLPSTKRTLGSLSPALEGVQPWLDLSWLMENRNKITMIMVHSFIYSTNIYSCSDFMPGNGDKGRKVTKIQRNQT